MDLSMEEFKMLADSTSGQRLRIAELERSLNACTTQLELFKRENHELKDRMEAAEMENIYLRNYITLSVEKIKSFLKRLNSLDKVAFLKMFMEGTLPKEHYMEQLTTVNELISLPEGVKEPTTINHYVTMTGRDASYLEKQ